MSTSKFNHCVSKSGPHCIFLISFDKRKKAKFRLWDVNFGDFMVVNSDKLIKLNSKTQFLHIGKVFR